MRKVLLISIGIIFLACVIMFISDVLLNIKRLTDLNNSLAETPYPINSNKLVMKNIRTGKMDTLQRGGPLIINMWATWCKPCIQEMPDLHRLAGSLSNVSIVLATFDSAALKPGKLDSLGISLPSYLVTDTNLLKKPIVLPTTLLIRGDSVLSAEYGARDWMDSSMMSRIRKTFE